MASQPGIKPCSLPLIIEDEPEANRLLALLVQLRGYQTRSALTGREGLDQAQRHQPDLIFLDLMLPDTDGFEVCRLLKADPTTAGIPVVMVTARLADENRIEGFRVGASEYLPKPYLPDQIFQAMIHADAWRSRIGCLDTLSVPLGGRSDIATLRGLGQLRNALLAREIPSAMLGSRLDAWLRGLVAVVGDWPQLDPAGPLPTLKYRRGPAGVDFTLDDLPEPLANDPALTALITAGPFGPVNRAIESGRISITLRCPVDHAL